MTERLDVYLHGQLTGHLTHTGGELHFVYAERHLTDQAIALSLSLPLREEPYPASRSLPFFEGLLPEGRLRERLAAQFGISRENVFGLLARVGGDCAGAVQLFPPDERPAEQGAAQSSGPLDEAALGEVLRELNRRPFVHDAQGRGQRLSLAGAQRKLPVVVDREDNVHLPGQAPSTHILKPPSEEYAELVANEYLCMRTAALAGLAAPAVAFRTYRRRDGSQWVALQVERYDREHAESGVLRIHQEDFCQALGLPSSLKYEEEGGPGLADCHRLIVAHARPPATAQRQLLRWVFFNLLIGNCDAHAKNIAFMHTRSGSRLAPVYDLVSTQIYAPTLTDRLAMTIGGVNKIAMVDKTALQQLSRELDINLGLARDMLVPFIDKVSKALGTASQEVRPYTRAPRMIERIESLVHTHRDRLVAALLN